MTESTIALLFSGTTLLWTAAWSIFLFRMQKRQRQEEKEERVSTKLSLESDASGTALCVEVHNSGNVSIPLETVELVWMEKEQSKESGIPFTASVHLIKPKMTELPVRKRAVFCLPPERLPTDVCEKLLRLSPADIWISIMSETREVERIDGSLVSRVLQRMNEIARMNIYGELAKRPGQGPWSVG